MAKIAIVTDTNSGILPQEAESLGVYTIPMPFFIDGKLYLEGKDIDAETFFRFQAADAEIKTSMPSVGDVADVWNRLLKTYDQLIYIPMSSGLSNSCSVTALMAQDEFPGRVFVVDNQRISVTQRQSVLEAKAMADAGMESGRNLPKTARNETRRLHLYRGRYAQVSASGRAGNGCRCRDGDRTQYQAGAENQRRKARCLCQGAWKSRGT